MRRSALLLAAAVVACSGPDGRSAKGLPSAIAREGFVLRLPDGWSACDVTSDSNAAVAVQSEADAIVLVTSVDKSPLAGSSREAINEAYGLGELLADQIRSHLCTVKGLGTFYARALFPPLGGTPIGVSEGSIRFDEGGVVSEALPDVAVDGRNAMRFRATSPYRVTSYDAAAYDLDSLAVGRRPVYDYVIVSDASDPFADDAKGALIVIVGRIDEREHVQELLEGLQLTDARAGTSSTSRAQTKIR